jgi:calcineurin-like phosphoesterase family protein
MRFYTSDTHFGHANILKYTDRPWADSDAMDAGLIDRWNSVVAPGDTVYHMGDVIMNMRSLHNVSQLNGTIHLVAGNHDPCWEGFKKGSQKAVERFLDAGFATVFPSGILRSHKLSDGRAVTLSHFPYDEGVTHHKQDMINDRYKDWRPTNHGEVNVCGHVHGAWKVNQRAVNVGVDVWDWYPVSEDTLIDTINREIVKR